MTSGACTRCCRRRRCDSTRGRGRNPIRTRVLRSSSVVQLLAGPDHRRPGRGRSAARGRRTFAQPPHCEHVNDLPALIDRPVEVGPAAGALEVGLVDGRAVTHRVPRRASGVDELADDRLHPSVHRHAINVDAALGQQLLDVAVGQALAQGSAAAESHGVIAFSYAANDASRPTSPQTNACARSWPSSEPDAPLA
jgi:hypothetical protein